LNFFAQPSVKKERIKPVPSFSD